MWPKPKARANSSCEPVLMACELPLRFIEGAGKTECMEGGYYWAFLNLLPAFESRWYSCCLLESVWCCSLLGILSSSC
jgi:hypothetical protein